MGGRFELSSRKKGDSWAGGKCLSLKGWRRSGTLPDDPAGSGKAPSTSRYDGKLVAEPYHMLVAGVRLGAGVAAAVRIPIAILHCGVHTGSPQPPSPDAPSPRAPHPGLHRRPSLTPLQFLTLPVTAIACGKSCVHPQGRRAVWLRHGDCAA